MSRRLDLTGQRYGKLTVLQEAEAIISGQGGNKTTAWLCRCDCGKNKIVATAYLRSGSTRSCGCLKKKQTYRHNYGAKKNPYYKTWSQMKKRCYCPTDIHYPRYGARGIRVADVWKKDFWVFYDYVSQLPHFGETGYTLDRIDNNGNYEPGNVRWASSKQQARNRSNNILIEAFGKTQTCAEWAEETGINYYTLHSRIFFKKWDVEKGLTTKVIKDGK